MRLFQAFLLTLFGTILVANNLTAQDLSEGKSLFNGRCASCHTINDGQRVGPELAGVNERREKEWLISFIKNSQAMIKEGNEIAKKLYNEYNKVVMPNHTDLEDNQIENILAYIADEAEAAQASASESSKSAEEGGSKQVKTEFAHQPKADQVNTHLFNPHSFDFLAAFWMTLGLVLLAAFGFIGLVLYFTR